MKYIKKFEAFNESTFIGIDGSMNYPPYLIAEDEDTLDIAFAKGEDAFKNDCDIEENPYLDVHDDMVEAWNDGFLKPGQKHKYVAITNTVESLTNT